MSWLRTFVPRPQARLRLFCFPHAGGAAGSYRPWTGLLPADVELVAVQYPGRHDRFGEPCAASMEELAAGAGADIAPLLDLPYAFFGHSMGATAAFETARGFQRAGLPAPLRLFVSARAAPSRSRPVDVDTGSDAALLAHVRELGSAGGMHLDAEPRLRPVVLPALRGDLAVLNSYRFTGEPVRCPITAISGSTDDNVSPEEIRAWQRHTTQPLHRTELPGGHFYLETATADLVELILRQVLAAV
jgi:surfactin synthase thioesterase subunit